jgi:hypothetical protein
VTSFDVETEDEDVPVERIGGFANGFELYRHRGRVLEASAARRSARLRIDDGVQRFEIKLAAGPIEWRTGDAVDVFYVARGRREHIVAVGDPDHRVWTPLPEVRRVFGVLPVRASFARARMLSGLTAAVAVVGFLILAAASQRMLGLDLLGAAVLGVAIVTFLAYQLAEAGVATSVERRIAERLEGWRKL